MPRMKDLAALIGAASREGSDAFQAGSDAALKKYLQAKQPEVEGQKQRATNEANMDALNDPRVQNLVNDGGSAKVGDIALGGNPYAKMAMQGPHQAQAFLHNAQAAYKGINDQLDASKATVDNLNLNNETGDRLALMNESKLALAGSGGRAFGAVMAQLSGDSTMAGDVQKAVNWFNNTPNIPHMTGPQRDAIRESVYARLPQIEQQHQQAAASLAQQGPIVAPQADTAGLINSMTTPVQQKLAQLKQMQADYTQSRQKQDNNPVSNPSVASPNQSFLQKLGGGIAGIFSGGSQQAPAQQQQAPPQDPNDPGLKRYQQLLQKAGMSQ